MNTRRIQIQQLAPTAKVLATPLIMYLGGFYAAATKLLVVLPNEWGEVSNLLQENHGQIQEEDEER